MGSRKRCTSNLMSDGALHRLVRFGEADYPKAEASVQRSSWASPENLETDRNAIRVSAGDKLDYQMSTNAAILYSGQDVKPHKF